MQKIFFLLLSVLMMQATSLCAQGYEIKVTIPKMPNKQVVLANYFEGKMYSVDTAHLNASGKGAFKKTDEKLARGMYLLIFSQSSFFDLIIGDDQHFSVKTDTVDATQNSSFEGSPENQAFLDFQNFMTSQSLKGKQLNEERAKEADQKSPEVIEKYKALFEQLDKEVRVYIANLCKQYPGSALATFADFYLSPKVPDFSKVVPEGTKDRDLEIRRKAYYYEKAHYWDHANLKDSTLIRVPGNMFKNKLDYYFKNMVLMHPDSVYKESVYIIEKSRGNKAMFRYLVSYCFNYALGSNIMGMDAAFVYIAKKYYLSGQADWVNKKTRDQIEREVALTQYNLIGMKAQDMKMPTIDGEMVSLHETKAPFTVLVFWEYNCGHCKTQVPLVKTKLLDKFKSHGLKVFAVHIQNKKAEWEKFITEHELFDFINCWDPHGQNERYREYYHIETTPIIYLLDKDKKIIGKKIDIAALEKILIQEYKKMGVEIK